MSDKAKQEKLTPAKNVSADILVPRLIFILSVLALLLFGLVMVFSASNVEALNNNESPYSYLSKQIIFCLVGVALAIFIWRLMPFKWINKITLWGGFIILMGFMVWTLVSGADILGARRWIYVGGSSLQPSEFVKIVLILIIALYIDEYGKGGITLVKCVGVVTAVSVGMILFIFVGQSDLGTTIICAVGIIAVLLFAGVPIWIIGGLIIGGGIIVVLIIFASPWRLARLMVFLDPYNDGAEGYGSGYQLIRSFYAFAEGGLFGVGLGNSYEKYQYLPEAETDFIFSIIGEELGLCGCILVIALFAALIISGIMMAANSKSRFAASISGSFVVMIGFQALLNILCVIGFAPTTGKPLPFISAGGSSLLATLLMIGFVLACSEQDALPDKYEKRRQNFKVSAPVGGGRIKATSADEVLEPKVNPRQTQTPKPTTLRSKTTRKIYTPKKSSATRGVKKTPNIKEPNFISKNDMKRQNSHNSYAYKRDKAAPSFKPRTSSIKSTSRSSTRQSSTKSKSSTRSKRK